MPGKLTKIILRGVMIFIFVWGALCITRHELENGIDQNFTLLAYLLGIISGLISMAGFILTDIRDKKQFSLPVPGKTACLIRDLSLCLLLAASVAGAVAIISVILGNIFCAGFIYLLGCCIGAVFLVLLSTFDEIYHMIFPVFGIQKNP